MEPTGLVLGAFPLLVDALDRYRTGLGVLKFTRQNNRDIDLLRLKVEIEYARLSQVLKLLFEPMGVEIGNILKWDSAKITASRLDTLLAERLLGAYPILVELMISIGACMNGLVRGFEKLDSTSMLRTKLRLISSSGDIERLLHRLSDYNHCLLQILPLKMNLNNTPTVESMRVRELLSNANMAQRDINILYQAIYSKETLWVRKLFLVSFRIPNLSRYRRQWQLLLAPPDSSAIRKPRQNLWLNVYVEFDKELEEQSRFSNLQPARELDLSVIRSESSINSFDKQRKSVRFQLPTMSRSEVRQQSRPAKVVSLLEFSHLLQASGPPSEYGRILIEDPAMLIDEADMLSLRDILRSSIRTSQVNRIRLAASLTWDVICLINTPWMKQGLKAVDIFFTRDHDVIRVDDLLICYSFDQKDTEQIDPRSLIQGRIFRLGVILLELSLHRNIDDLQKGQQPDHIPDELAERVLISRMIDGVYAESGTKYGDLVRRCVSFQFDSSLDPQHPKMLEEIQVLLIREVFSPLEELLKRFGSLDSEATINLAASGAISPKTKRLTDDSTTNDRTQGLREPSTRPPTDDFCLEHLSILYQYAFEVYQRCDADTFAFTRVMLAAKETLLSIQEADSFTHRILLDSSEEKELLNLARDCLADFVRLETFVQEENDGEALDDLTDRITLDSGSLALFNKRVTR